MSGRQWFFILLLVVPAVLGQTLRQNLEEAFRLRDAGNVEQARELFDRSLMAARETNDAWAEAEAHRGLGLILTRKAQYAQARAEFNEELRLYQTRGDRLGIGRIYHELAFLTGLNGDLPGRRKLDLEALAEFRAVGADLEQAKVLHSQSAITNDPTEKLKLVQEGLELAAKAGDRRLEALLMARWGDVLFSRGDYAGSASKIEQAVAILEKESAHRELGSVLSSLGRVYRAHGFHDKSLEVYLRAVALHERSDDLIVLTQSLNSVSVAYSRMGKRREELEYAERALETARKSGSSLWIRRQLLALASVHSLHRDYAQAVKIFDEVIAAGGDPDDIPWRNVAFAYRALKDPRALMAADRAVDLSRRKTPEFLQDALRVRAIIRKEAGNAGDALLDVEEGLRIVEKQRLGAVQTDAMKRGFAEENTRLFALAVELLHQSGRYSQAVETAELARGRAFLDLLASRETPLKPNDQVQLAALRSLERELHATGATPSLPPAGTGLPIVMRGADGPAEALWKRWRSAGPELRSFVTAEPMSAADLAETAVRLRSTLLVYWNNALTTYIWVVKPDGTVAGVSVAVTREQIVQQIAETSKGAGTTGARGGADTLAMRGGNSLTITGIRKDPWRQLHRWLIEPVQHLLPKDTDSLLTIVPHGPLFQVSFAALMDERGRYLIERHRIHYTPAGAVLSFTRAKKSSLSGERRQFLLVADPAGMAAADDKPLPPLPGARREVSAIAKLLPAGQVTVLAGDQAREPTVRSAAAGKAVVHFATHGILRNDEPSQSFLALARSPAQSIEDGRLTASEVYQMDLKADLVVLSACRSALGAVSADGIIGLTRSFFYAGTASVMATVWDVADEPTSRLISGFYRNYSGQADKSRALRQAQLQLIADLRNGRVQAASPLGALTLPEHPLFWAGFVLVGEP
jgi:CHAT domain-containing protein/tetratricopeptide (TPR) repeat protein